MVELIQNIKNFVNRHYIAELGSVARRLGVIYILKDL